MKDKRHVKLSAVTPFFMTFLSTCVILAISAALKLASLHSVIAC